MGDRIWSLLINLDTLLLECLMSREVEEVTMSDMTPLLTLSPADYRNKRNMITKSNYVIDESSPSLVLLSMDSMLDNIEEQAELDTLE